MVDAQSKMMCSFQHCDWSSTPNPKSSMSDGVGDVISYGSIDELSVDTIALHLQIRRRIQLVSC